MLPIFVIMKIVLYLDMNSRNELKKVNDFWVYIIDEIKKEENTRNNLNKLILKLESQVTNYSKDQLFLSLSLLNNKMFKIPEIRQ